MTVAAPADQFEAFASNFVTMCQSYKINDKFAQDYIARGMERLRQMQKETAAIVARNAREIREMMQAAYDERQKSMEYIDYQRTKYIRGESDWVSSMEGSFPIGIISTIRSQAKNLSDFSREVFRSSSTDSETKDVARWAAKALAAASANDLVLSTRT